MLIQGQSIDDVEQAIGKYSTVLLYFHAPWCGACKAIDSMLADMPALSEATDVAVVVVDVAEQADLGVSFGVASLPYFISYRDGVLAESRSGAISTWDLREFLEVR